MPTLPDTTLELLGCSTLTGDACPSSFYRHNGRWSVRAAADVADERVDTSARAALIDQILTFRLTPLERRTWRLLLQRGSISQVAKAEGVSRAAIYARIRGSRRSPGMIAKNPFVAEWWARRGTHE